MKKNDDLTRDLKDDFVTYFLAYKDLQKLKIEHQELLKKLQEK